MTKRKISPQYGFTLLEVLAGMAILSIFIMVIFGFFSQSMMFSNKNERNLVSINLAREVLTRFTDEHVTDPFVDSNNQPVTEWTCANAYGDYIYLTDTLVYKNGELAEKCFYFLNDTYFYPEIKIKNELTGLVEIHVKIYYAAVEATITEIATADNLLAETYGYLQR